MTIKMTIAVLSLIGIAALAITDLHNWCCRKGLYRAISLYTFCVLRYMMLT